MITDLIDARFCFAHFRYEYGVNSLLFSLISKTVGIPPAFLGDSLCDERDIVIRQQAKAGIDNSVLYLLLADDLLIAYPAAGFLANIIRVVCTGTARTAVVSSTRMLKRDIFESITRRDFIAYKQRQQGEYISKLTTDADAIKDRRFRMLPMFFDTR